MLINLLISQDISDDERYNDDKCVVYCPICDGRYYIRCDNNTSKIIECCTGCVKDDEPIEFERIRFDKLGYITKYEKFNFIIDFYGYSSDNE